MNEKNLSSVELKISDVPDFNYSDDKLLIELLDRRFGESDEDTEVLRLNSSLDDEPLYLLLASGHVQRSRSKFAELCSTCLLQARDPVSAKDTADRFVKLQNAKEVPVLVKGLNVIERDLADLRLSTDDRQPYLDADIGLTRLIALRNLGDGMNRLADLILAMHEASNGIVFIDEIENGLHHTIHQAVWKVIDQMSMNSKVQVFATTHSLEMIRAAYDAFVTTKKLDDFRYHRLDRDDNSSIEATTYDEVDLKALATFGFDHEVR